jgi:hypothetical protein
MHIDAELAVFVSNAHQIWLELRTAHRLGSEDRSDLAPVGYTRNILSIQDLARRLQLA